MLRESQTLGIFQQQVWRKGPSEDQGILRERTYAGICSHLMDPHLLPILCSSRDPAIIFLSLCSSAGPIPCPSDLLTASTEEVVPRTLESSSPAPTTEIRVRRVYVLGPPASCPDADARQKTCRGINQGHASRIYVSRGARGCQRIATPNCNNPFPPFHAAFTS